MSFVAIVDDCENLFQSQDIAALKDSLGNLFNHEVHFLNVAQFLAEESLLNNSNTEVVVFSVKSLKNILPISNAGRYTVILKLKRIISQFHAESDLLRSVTIGGDVNVWILVDCESETLLQRWENGAEPTVKKIVSGLNLSEFTSRMAVGNEVIGSLRDLTNVQNGSNESSITLAPSLLMAVEQLADLRHANEVADIEKEKIQNRLNAEEKKRKYLERELGRFGYRAMVRVRGYLNRYFGFIIRPAFTLAAIFIHFIKGLGAKLKITIKYKDAPWPEERPLLSVVIPCFNYGRFVLDAIRSINAQTFKNLEIVVVDGGSTDSSTIEVLKSIRQSNTRVFFREGRHLVGDNRNFGINQSLGKYVCCLDADDLLRPTYFESALYLLEAKKLDVVSCSVEVFGSKIDIWSVPEVPSYKLAKVVNVFSTVAVFSKEIWMRAGGYHDFGLGKDHIHEDWCLWQRFLALGARGGNILSPLMRYRVHSTASLSQQGGVVPGIEKQRLAIANFNRDVNTFSNFVFRFFRRFITYKNINLVNNFRNPSADRSVVLVVNNLEMIANDKKFLEIVEKNKLNNNFSVVSLLGKCTFLDNFDRIFFLDTFLTSGQKKEFIKFLRETRQSDIIEWDVALGNDVIAKSSDTSKLKFDKKIVICVPWLDFGGSAVLLKLIFSKLKLRGYSITVIASNPSENPSGKKGQDLFENYSSDIIDLPVSSENKSEFIESVVISRRADILLIVGCKAAYKALPTLKNAYTHVKVIDHLYNPYGHIGNNKQYRKFIDFNIAANEDVAQAIFKNGFDKEKIAVIHHGIDIGPFHGNFKTKATPDIVFGFLGRFSSEKRPSDFILLAKHFPENRFVMAGEGPLLDECRTLIAKERVTNCQIFGFIEDASSFFGLIDVLVLTSEIEGLPLVLLEAMSEEKTVIASSVGHIPKLIEEGVNGFKFRPGDLVGLVNAVQKYLDLKPEMKMAMGAAARETVVNHYNAVKCADTYDMTFSSVCEGY